MGNLKVKPVARAALWICSVLLIWCSLILLYLKAYDLIERSAVPVMLSTKEFMASSWDNGYFSAKGSFENQSATSSGDGLPLQTNAITCDRSAGTCTIATGDVFENFLNVDLSSYDVTSWTNQQITFADDMPICATNAYIIDRAAQTVTLLVRKRAVIPDYALKSPLHPCDNVKDQNVNLADGFKIYWRKKTEFEARNGFYFHSVLVGMNVVFFGVAIWLWRRRRRAATAG